MLKKAVWLVVFLALTMVSVTAAAQVIDLVFVIDTSGSIDDTELNLEIGGLQAGVNHVLLPAVPPATINIGVVCFGTTANILLPLTPLNTTTVTTLINPAINNAITCDRGSTNMTDGLNKASALLASGTAPRKLINLVTDGAPNSRADTVTAANSAKLADIELWTLGVGQGADNAFLDSIAGLPPAHNTPVTSFADFERAETEKLRKIIQPTEPLESFEQLLEKQAALLGSFTELLEGQVYPSIEQLKSLEDLLDRQAERLNSFEELLLSRLRSLCPDRLLKFLISLEDLLKSQCELLKRFEGLLARLRTIPPELLLSFEELIRKQAELLEGFEELLKYAQRVLPPCQITKLIESFEELLRLQDELLESFEQLLKGQPPLDPDPPVHTNPTTTTTTYSSVITINDFRSILGSSFGSPGPVTRTISTPAGMITITLKGNSGSYYMALGEMLYLTPGSMELDFKDLNHTVKRVEITVDDWAGVGKTQVRSFDPTGNLLSQITNSATFQKEILSVSEGKTPIGFVEVKGRQTFIHEIRIILG